MTLSKSNTISNSITMTETPRTPKVAIIAERLSAIRKEKGTTQIEMAKKLKVTQSMYSRYERGDARIYSDLLCKMATILAVTPNDLCGVTKSGNDTVDPMDHSVPKRFIRRLRGVETMTRTEQDSLLTVIDTWLEASKVRRNSKSSRASA